MEHRPSMPRSLYQPLWFHKLINYEYWPIWLFYIPIAIYIFWLAIKARSFTYFTTVNPGIKNSGIFNYSKYKILQDLPPSCTPRSILLNRGEKITKAPQGLLYPIIAKPDMGERGKGVKLLYNDGELQSYMEHTAQDIILQEYIDLPSEAGIFYVRQPSEKKGTITSFTTKRYLSIIGDGQSTIRSLMSHDYRAKLQIRSQKKDFLAIIPRVGEYVKIEPIGNHNRGTKFINSNHLISKQLIDTFDQIASNVEGFYYGRFDLKYLNIEDLALGKNIKIVELNGINSEPTHIYDQSRGIISAYKDFFHHQKLLYEIAQENYKRGIPRTKASEFWTEVFTGKIS
jgi:hypothetical protein